jgi:hypothetical protein
MDVNKTWPMAPFCGWWLRHTPEKSEMFMAKNGCLTTHQFFKMGQTLRNSKSRHRIPVCSHSYLKYIYICSGSHLSAMLS